jgi:hypothetical protein
MGDFGGGLSKKIGRMENIFYVFTEMDFFVKNGEKYFRRRTTEKSPGFKGFRIVIIRMQGAG